MHKILPRYVQGQIPVCLLARQRCGLCIWIYVIGRRGHRRATKQLVPKMQEAYIHLTKIWFRNHGHGLPDLHSAPFNRPAVCAPNPHGPCNCFWSILLLSLEWPWLIALAR